MHASQITKTLGLLQNLQDYLEHEKRMFDSRIVATAIQLLIRESHNRQKWLSETVEQKSSLDTPSANESLSDTRNYK